MRLQTIKFLIFLLPLQCYCQSYIPGYQSTIAGENLQYHSPQPDATTSLLVRSEDSTRFIAWESALIPPIPKSPNLQISKSPNLQISQSTLLLLAGIDVNPGDPHRWKVYINDNLFFPSTPLPIPSIKL